MDIFLQFFGSREAKIDSFNIFIDKFRKYLVLMSSNVFYWLIKALSADNET